MNLSIRIAFAIVGAGSGGFNREEAQATMKHELGTLDYPLDVVVFVYRRGG